MLKGWKMRVREWIHKWFVEKVPKIFVLLHILYGSFVSKNDIFKPLKHVERLKHESQGMKSKMFGMKSTRNSGSITDFIWISSEGVARPRIKQLMFFCF